MKARAPGACPYRFLMLVLGLLALLSASGADSARPNIVILAADDLGYGDLGCFGHPVIKTPHLDRLASEGLTLRQCYTSFPVCSPSRAGMLTGRNANRYGIRDWIPRNSGVYLHTNEITIARLLQSAGYATAHVGKWHLNSRTDGSEPGPGDHGFDHGFYTQNNAAPSHENPTNFSRNDRRVGPLQGFSCQLVVREAIRFLESTGSRPFFLNVWFHEPHEPIATDGGFVSPYQGQGEPTAAIYYGNVSMMDDAAGRLLRYLDEHGLRENTFVLFTSDNGPETLKRYRGAERSHGSPGPLRGMKLHLTEAGIRVPGIIRWPGRVRPGTTSTEPVSNLDLLPTLCEIAGLRPPDNRALDGASLVPLFAGKSVIRKRPLYWQYDKAISLPWKMALRDGPWKLLGDDELQRFELYNLDSDIGETNNLAAMDSDRVTRMATQMKRLHQEFQAEAGRPANAGKNAP